MHLLYIGIFSSFLDNHLSISLKERAAMSFSFLYHRRRLFRYQQREKVVFAILEFKNTKAIEWKDGLLDVDCH